MANRFNFVSPFAAMSGGIREFLAERELQRRQAVAESVAESEQAKRLALAQAAETRAAAAQEVQARLQREQFEAGLAEKAITMAGANERLAPGSEAATRIQKYYPSRVEEREALEGRLPSAAMAVQTGLGGEAAPVVPGMMSIDQGQQAQEGGLFIRPGPQYERERAAASERKESAQMAAQEKAAAAELARSDREQARQDQADLRRELQADRLEQQREMARTARGQSQQTATNRRVDQTVNRFDANPITKRYATLSEASAFVNSLSPTTESPSDDQGLVYAFAKAMDPDSAVREGEYATVQRYAQSWITKFGFDARRVVEETQFLTPRARTFIKDTIRAKAAAGKTSYTQLRREFADRINRLTGEKDGDTYLADYGVPVEPATATPDVPAETLEQRRTRLYDQYLR